MRPGFFCTCLVFELEGPNPTPACKDKNKDDDGGGEDEDSNALRHELYDMRCFFLCPVDRLALFEKIDARCEKLVLAGILAETAGLLARDTLRPGSVASRAIGYRQAIEYLCRSNGDGSGDGEPFERGDEKAFDAFLQKFGTATRNYAAQQLKWFRRDRAFFFLPVPLGTTEGNHSAASPVGGADENALEVVRRLATCPRDEYEAALQEDRQVAIREDLVKQGKKMRTYAPRRTLLTKPPPPPPPPSKSALKRRAKAARARAQSRAQAQNTGTQNGLSPKRKWEDVEMAGISSDNGAFGTAKAGSKGYTPISEPCHFLDEAIAAADAAVDEIAAAGMLNQLRTECAKEHGHGASFD